jgi:light-regulated signal transduction histidine kinase (bacteriophytochrome)
VDQLEDPDAFVTQVQRLYAHKEESSSDVLKFKDGRVFERYSQPHEVKGKIVGRVWSFRDMTERAHAEDQQTHLLDQLEQKNQELKEFAYIVSHDLKAPLRGVKVIADWIAQDYGDKLDDDGKEQINLLVSRVDRMRDLIDGVLQYSRIGRAEEKNSDVNLNHLVTEIIDGIAPPETLRIHVEEDLPVVHCEPTRIMQVLQNLISNAVKYMDKPEGRITIGCEDQGTCWRFGVSDNGPGIDSQYFESIFRMFQTLAPRDQFESTGVGLAVVKRIVEMYGGSIWVESTVGQGSTFYFTLPKAAVAPERPEALSAGTTS